MRHITQHHGAEISFVGDDSAPEFGFLEGFWMIQPPGGPNVALSWNSDRRQWYVSINTEEMGAEHHDEHDDPYLLIEVNNSGPLYDRTPSDAGELREQLAKLHMQLWGDLEFLDQERQLVNMLEDRTGQTAQEIRRQADLDAETLITEREIHAGRGRS